MWRAVPIKIHLTMLRRLFPYREWCTRENLGSVCRQDSQTLSLEYTFVAKNIPLNIQILPKITRSYTVSGVSIPFIRPIQIWTITPFLNMQYV